MCFQKKIKFGGPCNCKNVNGSTTFLFIVFYWSNLKKNNMGGPVLYAPVCIQDPYSLKTDSLSIFRPFSSAMWFLPPRKAKLNISKSIEKNRHGFYIIMQEVVMVAI